MGQLKPGERIQELKVAGELDVSRGSVREALLILERRHLIRIFPRKGAVVSALSPDLVNSLYDIYIHLLTMLVQKVAERWTEKDLTPLMRQTQWLERLIAAPKPDTGEIIEAGFSVMQMCYPVVDNPYLEETLENFRPAISRTYYLAMQEYRTEAERTQSFFRDLITYAQQRDQKNIARVISEFGEHQRDIVMEALAAHTELTSDVAS